MKTRTQRIQDQDKEEEQKKNKKKTINQKDIDSNKNQEVKGNKKIKTQNPIPIKNKKSNQNKPIRIANDEPNNKPNDKEQKKDEHKDDKKGGNSKQEAKQQVKTFQFKGKVPIDEYCPLKNANHSVLQYQGKVYSATLNQSNVVQNNNKFYILQIIQHDNNPNQCYLFTRWGRVGVEGQKSQVGPMSIAAAIRQYLTKYHQKHNKGDYRQIELNYEVQEQKKKQTGPQKKKDTKQEVFNKSKLPIQVKRLIELIFDINMMNKHMIQIGYDVSRMPLGKLSKDNIMKGYKILQELINEIKGKVNRKKIQQFSNDFYSFIPHDIGFARMGNFILDNEQKVKKKIEMLEALAEIKVATNLIGDAESQNQNIIDSNYAKLKRQIDPVDRGHKEFQVINEYLQTTHADTHKSYNLQLQDLFKLKSQTQDIRYTKNVGNKMLLWHGSRLTNFVGILSQGLRIAPPEAPVTGYMFGKGVYFADMSSKSANYCFTNRQNYTGILLLCEVALGDMNQKYQADPYAANLPPGKLSTKGIGRIAPNPQNQVELQKGVAIPMGPGQQTNKMGCSLMYNQFIVYDISQIKIKYLLRTKFNYKGY